MTVAPDTEQGVKAHAKANLAPELLAGRVFFSMPEGTPPLPLVTVEQVGGTYDDTAPVDRPRLSFSCWGVNKAQASTVRRALLDYLFDLPGTDLDDGTHCYEVADFAVLFLRDPGGQLCRYVVDATVSARSR
jgi:hypothetical protein